MRGILGRLYRGENDFDFVRAWRVGLVVSLVLVLASLASFAVRGLEWGIDFVGGTAWEVPSSELGVAETRDVVSPFGLDTAKIQTVGNDLVRVQGPEASREEVEEVRAALADAAGVAPEEVAVTQVGPSWGDEISSKAMRALVAFFVAVTLYITIALRDWRKALAAVVAVAHDVLISVGVYSLFRLEVTPATVIAFLTILGFSLYDTVVVFDRLRDNTARVALTSKMTYTELANLTMNQVLMRSLNTSITSLLPVLSILVVGSVLLGATTLQEFGVALAVGLLVGTYSSIFVATPILAWLKEREATWRERREKMDRRGGAPEAVSEPPAEVAEPEAPPVATASRPKPATSTAIPPRPRKNRRR